MTPGGQTLAGGAYVRQQEDIKVTGEFVVKQDARSPFPGANPRMSF